MKLLTILLLSLLVTTPALSSPWEKAGRAPGDAAWVVAWEFDERTKLLPFWELALQLDLEISEADVPTFQSLLGKTGLKPVQLAELLDGSGSVWRSSDGLSYQLSLGLVRESGLEERLAALWQLEAGSPVTKQFGSFQLECGAEQLVVRVGEFSEPGIRLSEQADYLEAQSKLNSSSTLMAYRGPSKVAKYAALSLDLNNQTSLGFLALRNPNTFKSSRWVASSLVTSRPRALETILLLDPERLSVLIERLQTEAPEFLRQAALVMRKGTNSGSFYDLIESPGLVGVNSNPLALLLGSTDSHTLYATASFRDLDGLEELLANLEYQSRLHTLEKCEQNLNHLTYQLSRYEVDFKQKTPPDFQALVPELLPKVPNCPAAGRPTYAIDNSGENWAVYCRGAHHPQTPPDHPRFDRKLGMLSGEHREKPALGRTSRVDSSGYASYRLVSGQRIEIDSKNKTVCLADGELDREFLSRSQKSGSLSLPEWLEENLRWSEGRLLYVDYTDISSSLTSLKIVADQHQGDQVPPLLAKAFLEGLSQAEVSRGSNAFRWDTDGLAYRGRGIWTSTAVLASITTTPLWVRAYRREQKLDIARQCRHNLQSLVHSLTKFRAENGVFPDKLQDLVPKYLDSLPLCPVAQKDTYTQSYYWETRTYGGNFPDRLILELCCLGHHHTSAGWEENQPRYNLQEGAIPKD